MTILRISDGNPRDENCWVSAGNIRERAVHQSGHRNRRRDQNSVQQRAKRLEIDRVESLIVSIPLGGFEVHREFGRERVVENVAEWVESHVALTDRLVTVHSTAELLLLSLIHI